MEVVSDFKKEKKSKYPFSTMEVGSAFEVPEDKKNSVSALASMQNKNTDKKFSVEKYEDGKFWCKRVS